MTKKMKKIAAVLTALCLCVGQQPLGLGANTVQAAEPGMRTVYLSDLAWKSEMHTADAHLETQKDKNFGGEQISLKVDGKEQTFSKGIGTQTDSTIVYDLEGKDYTRFQTYLGVDYSQRASIAAETCDVKFTVSLDNEAVYTSKVLDPDSEAELVDIEIPEGTKELKLYADKVNESWSDWADYGDARFTQTLPEPENVALNKKIGAYKTADGTAAAANPDMPASNAVDGEISTSSYFDYGDQSQTGAKRESLYVGLDLGGSFLLSDIQMWRYWSDSRTYDATVIAVSEDQDFETYSVIYNSDTENVHGLGAGEDARYRETSAGTNFEVPEGTKARYVRVYTYGVQNGGVTNHIAELMVNAYVFGDEVEPEEPGNSKVFPNAKEPLTLEGPGTNGQVTHPDIQVLDEEWNGYRYWMAYTPNKPASSYFENPCIAASNDGENWVFPAKNPVQPRYDSEIENQNEHNCDTDIVYDPVNNRMIMYWEWAQDQAINGKTHSSEIRYRISYDGVHWGIPDENGEIQDGPQDHGCAIRTEGERYSDLSPTVVFDENEKIYKMWANDAGDVGYENKERNKVWYRTSKDGLTGWSDKTYVKNFLGVNEDGLQMYPWHQDIQWVDEFQEYWALQQAFPAGSGPDNSSLRFSKSKDGINWEPVSEKALITVGKPGTWDAGQIYRSTFWYEPSGTEGQGTFHIWYAALAEGQSHWDIGYTHENYTDVMDKLTGIRPAAEKRIQVDSEHPLLIMPLYGKSYSPSGSTLDWGDDLVGRWDAVPEDLKNNAVIEIHIGGKIGLNENDSHTAKAFYEQQLQIAQEHNIPVMIVVATAGQQTQWTGTRDLDAEWLDRMFKEHSVLKGIMSTENYWTSYNTVATMGADYLRVAHENGGYFVWSEHQEGVIENVMANTAFKEALEKYSDSFIFTWKNTPASSNSNAGTASYMQGLWLTGVCAQWGGLADTWKWYEKKFGKLFAGTYTYNAGGEEARPVATEPEALLGIEMMSIYTNGGCVYNFEHPAYVYGSYNQNSPLFENVVAQFMRYAIANPAPSREDVLEDTEIAFYGKLSTLKDSGKLLQKDLGWQDATLPTQVTGRYGLIPAVPQAVNEDKVNAVFAGKTVISQNSPQVQDTESKLAFFQEKYPESYQGSAFAQLVNDTWYLYNSNVNVDGEQNAKLGNSGNKTLNITMTPHTFVILKEKDGGLQVKLNNYRVNKDSIWEGYGTTVTDRWDTDHNTKLQDWVRDTYIPNPDDNTFRTTTFELTGLENEPTVAVSAGQTGQYEEPVVSYQKAEGTTAITLSSNGWMDFMIYDGEKPIEPVDKSALQTKLAEAKAIGAEGYTAESYKKLQDAIRAAEAVEKDKDASQTEVNGQITALTEAIKNLVKDENPGETQAEKDKKAAASVSAQITSIGTVTLAREEAVKTARAAYNALTENQKKLVTNYQTLTAAENRIAVLKFEAKKVLVKASNIKAKNIKLTWNKIQEADGYTVFVKKGSKWVQLKDLKKSGTTSYIYTKGTPGKKDTFAVKAYKLVNGIKVNSGFKTVTAKAIPQTVTLSKKASRGKITLSWKKISGVSGYSIRKKEGKRWKKEVFTKPARYVDKKVKKGRTYSYKVRAYKVYRGKKVCGSFSRIISVKAK